MKLCLCQMNRISRDEHNRRRIKYLLPVFDNIPVISREKALAKPIIFNSTNQRAEEAYKYGLLFLNNIFSTLSAGNTSISMMLFNMNDLYELFVYRVSRIVFGNKAIYQMRGNYLLERDLDRKKYVNLRPDITIKNNTGGFDIIDTKWKIPKNFVKESDTYQMNAYSSSIKNVERVFLLYPYVERNDIVGDYSFIDLSVDWKRFVKEFETIFVPKSVCL